MFTEQRSFVNGRSLALGVVNRDKLICCSTPAMCSATAKLYQKLSVRPLCVVNHECTVYSLSYGHHCSL